MILLWGIIALSALFLAVLLVNGKIPDIKGCAIAAASDPRRMFRRCRFIFYLFRKSYSKLLDVFSDFFPHFTRVRAAFSKVGCIQLKPLEGQ